MDWVGQALNDVAVVQVDLYQSDPTMPTCEVFYYADTHTFSLFNDGGGACSLVAGGSTWQANGLTLTTNFSLQFDITKFTGELQVAFAASNAVGDDGGGNFGSFRVQ